VGSVVTCVIVVVRVLVLSGWVVANCSPRLAFGSSCVVGCSPSLGLVQNLLFYQCIKTQCFLHFCEKKIDVAHTLTLHLIDFRFIKTHIQNVWAGPPIFHFQHAIEGAYPISHDVNR
jgi:hypothetical protein